VYTQSGTHLINIIVNYLKGFEVNLLFGMTKFKLTRVKLGHGRFTKVL